jgi:hypothetical protein
MAEVASYCTYCGSKIEPNSRFCSSCGRATSLAAGAGGGGRIVRDVGGGRVAGTAEKRASAGWYLLPLLFGLIGGIIMFVALKDEDRGRANGGLKLGIVLTLIGVILMILFFAAIGAT